MEISAVVQVKDINAAFRWLRDVNNIISVLPNVVKVEGNKVKLRFTRLLFFSLESTFTVTSSMLGERVIEYWLVGDKGNQIRIMLVEKGNGQIEILAFYQGEKAWIVNKNLSKIVEEIKKGLEKEMQRLEIRASQENYSKKLGKISFVSKIIMKSKLLNTEGVSVKEGGLVNYLEGLISQYSKYPVFYLSGTGNGTFRILFINGELKGVYVVLNENEYFDEEALNKLSGDFKVNIYAALTPYALEVTE